MINRETHLYVYDTDAFYAADREIGDNKLEAAIGHLSLWGLNSATITKVSLSFHVDADLFEVRAVYASENPQNAPHFVMGAIYRRIKTPAPSQHEVALRNFTYHS